MTERPEQFRQPTKFELVLDFLKSRLLTLVGLALIAVAVLVYFEVSLEVPRWAKLAGLTFLALMPVGFLTGNYIVSLLWNPNHIFLVDLDASVIDGALYRFPYSDFRELTVTDENGNADAPYEMTQLASHLYVGKGVDLEEMTVVGTWRGTLDDRELARALQAVRECRGQLQEDAQRGFVLETSAFTIVRSAARATALDVIEMVESGRLPDQGEALTEAVDSALEQFDFSEELENVSIEDEPTPEEASERPGEVPEDHPLNRYDENGHQEVSTDG